MVLMMGKFIMEGARFWLNFGYRTETTAGPALWEEVFNPSSQVGFQSVLPSNSNISPSLVQKESQDHWVSHCTPRGFEKEKVKSSTPQGSTEPTQARKLHPLLPHPHLGLAGSEPVGVCNICASMPQSLIMQSD